MSDRVHRLRSGLARRLDPEAAAPVAPAAPEAPTPRTGVTRREVREFLDALDADAAGGPMQASVAGAFSRLWQPRRGPAPAPPDVVRRVIEEQFHRMHHVSRRTWRDTTYRGARVEKSPTDLWVYQEIVDRLRPGLVVETGTAHGGSALLVADRLHLAGRGQIVSIDPTARPDRPVHPRLTYLTGSPVDPDVLADVRRRIDPALPVLVVLGAGTTQDAVAAQLRAYAPLVPLGSYLVVEETHLGGHPVEPDHGPGPWEAVQEFLAGTEEFEVDRRAERYLLTHNPSGYLRRVGGQSEPVLAARRADRQDDQRDTGPAPDPSVEHGHAAAAVRTLADVRLDGERPSVVLVLQAFEPGQFFAGIRTAVLAAARLAHELGRDLRVVVVAGSRSDEEDAHRRSVEVLAELVRAEGLDAVADGLRLSTPERRESGAHTADDVWVATYWTTAAALAVLARDGRTAPERVVYLVQDFEPGFYPWGPEYAQALATYEEGFTTLVNSASLARYLQDVSGTRAEAVFAPALDPAPLHAAAAAWRPAPEGEVRVLFYARPGKPRNMYAAGLAALRAWADGLPDGLTGVVRLAGEVIAEGVDLGPRARVEVLGKLSYEGYHDLLAETDLGLALMLSPHPGHLALELPMAGIPTVTNDFARHREAWVDGLTLSGTQPAAIAARLLELTAQVRGLTAHEPRLPGPALGGDLADAVRTVADSLRA